MPLDLHDLMRLHDKAYQAGQINRERAADDMVFYYVTQWDDNVLQESQLAYRGEFNILKKAGRQILTDLFENPIQIDFDPLNETREDSSELADGMYRRDDSTNTSIESYEIGQQESVVCGVGAWELYTEYESLKTSDRNQVIRRRPIYEANNTTFWDPNAKRLDKSDATYVSILTAYSEDGYIDLVKDLTGEEVEKVDFDSFKHPEHSYAFPWIGGEGKKIYVASFYHRIKSKAKILTMSNPFGQTLELLDSDIKEVEDDLLESGFEIESEKTTEVWEVYKYIASGSQILSVDKVAGEHIPVVPIYGDRAYIEGEEHYEGVTRLAKDPQRLRNFAMSYLADIVSRSPRPKPIFTPEQVQGHEDMYSEVGSENHYPYLLQNSTDGQGKDLPLGPVGIMPEQTMPTTLSQLFPLTKEAVEDVANPGVPQDIADPMLSGKAVGMLQRRIDQQSVVYQQHFRHAKRRDAEIYISMASDVYDVPRKTMVTLPDGTQKEAQIMETIIDAETGDVVTLNDLSNAEFDVRAKIGPSYTSQKEQTIDRLGIVLQGMAPNDPNRMLLQLKMLELMDGVDFDDIRDYSRKQLILRGVKKPDTPEEEQMLAQAQQAGSEPSAEDKLAEGEFLKGRAAIMKEQRETMKMQLEYKDKGVKNQIDGFNAETKRMDTMVDAQEANANIRNKDVDTFSKSVETQIKLNEATIKGMSNDDLFEELMRGEA